MEIYNKIAPAIWLSKNGVMQDKIHNANIPNVIKYAIYTQCLILKLKLTERLFSLIFALGHASAAQGTWYETVTTEYETKLSA